MASHQPTGHLKTRSRLEALPSCEPNTYKPISRCHNVSKIEHVQTHFCGLKYLLCLTINMLSGIFLRQNRNMPFT